MKAYIKNLISNSDEASHKRFISLASFLVLVIMVAIKAFGGQLSDTLIYVFVSLVGGESALSVIEKFRKS